MEDDQDFDLSRESGTSSGSSSDEFIDRSRSKIPIESWREQVQSSLLEHLSPEVFTLIAKYLSAKGLLNLSETCKKLYADCLGNGALWRQLCKKDFEVDLQTTGLFDSFHGIYKLFYKARIILEETNHVTFSGMLPDWMFSWCILSKRPPSFEFMRLPAGKTKKLWGLCDDELPPRLGLPCSRRSFSWAEGYEAAVAKRGSVVSFQEQALRRCVRSQRKIHSLFPKELMARRKRHYQKLRLEDHYSVMSEVLAKNKEQHSYMCFFEPQMIGEDYINGKLHRFGSKQLDEYIKFAQRLYDQVSSQSEEYSINDLVGCVLLTYEQLSERVFNSFVTCEEFRSHCQQYLERVQQVWDWQKEKGTDHLIKYRASKEVKELPAYKNFIKFGDLEHFKNLKIYFEGLEKLSSWLELNGWIRGLLDNSVIAVLEGKDPTLPNSRSTELKRKTEAFLQSGNEGDFRSILSTICSFARQYLKTSSVLVKELENVVYGDDSDLLMPVRSVVIAKGTLKDIKQSSSRGSQTKKIKVSLESDEDSDHHEARADD